MKFIKKLLAKILSAAGYVKAMHRGFFFLFGLGFLKGNPKFKYHYAVKNWIKPTDHVVDIGANLGYFAKVFADLTPEGKVTCIEPIPLFYSTLKHFLGNRPGVGLHNVALGDHAGSVTMALPETDGFIRTGLPHIIQDSKETAHKTQEVEVARASQFFSSLKKVDYIKCDIEGYEAKVFLDIKNELERLRPVVQLEISKGNVDELLELFKKLNYAQFGICDFKLIEESGEQAEQGDYLFIPEEKKIEFIAFAKSK